MRGLTHQEVEERKAKKQTNKVSNQSSRSYGQIFFSNIFTFVNNVLFGLGIALILMNRTSDALVSVGVILVNVVVSVVQEIRAKRMLDKIALLTRPAAVVIRDGEEKTIDPDEIVLDDWLKVGPGDQIVVDGRVLEGQMEADESLLTGETDSIIKKIDSEVFSGSFCVTGSAVYRATKVGKQSMANQLTAHARAYRHILTPLQEQVNLVLRLLVMVAVFMLGLLAIRTVLDHIPLVESVKMSVVIIGLVPNGLFLAMSVAYALGAVRIAQKGALVQQANAVESLSNVDTLCLDKTGTLTANRIRFHQIYPGTMDEEALKALLGDFAASVSAPNATSSAIHNALKGRKIASVSEAPFSSARKWSGLVFNHPEKAGTFVLGAPDMLRNRVNGLDPLEPRLKEWSDAGFRVLLMAGNLQRNEAFQSEADFVLPDGLEALGLVCFTDELRPDAEETLGAFRKAGVNLKIISGDNPDTVASLARQAGMSKEMTAVSGLDLARMSESQFADAVEQNTIFGRITPQQKEQLVQSLRQRGHYVAMIGDGVNDVLSLKKANLGIAMQSGSQATRSVADIVLMGDAFGVLPSAVTEGQRIINGMQDILKLFLTRIFYVAMLIISVGVLDAFPYAPKNISILTLFTVGLPTLALAAWARPALLPRQKMLRGVIHFVLPAGMWMTLGGLAVFLFYFAQGWQVFQQANLPIKDFFTVALGAPQTALTVFSIFCGLLLIPFVEPPSDHWTGGDDLSGDKRPLWMAIGLGFVFIIILAIPALSSFFDLVQLGWFDYLVLLILAGLWGWVMRKIWRSRLLERFLGTEF
ncbi:MAG TPA: HAD-IC family P-type ATPase [Anaerolineaceae bacterium]|nr:HAD-IC family P-type ATPase [Anaerolineaceae bacterium]HPN50818.1 HAD-IC family P-type ATPase [Anaerolineaceae bacterium]